MTAPITPDERAAMRRLALTTPQTPGEHAYVEHVPRLLDALDTAEAERGEARAASARVREAAARCVADEAAESELTITRQRERLRAREEQVRRLRAEVTRLHALVADQRARAALGRGLAQSAAGDVVDLGDFSQYATSPAWDEDAVIEAMARAANPRKFRDGYAPFRGFGETRSDDELRECAREAERHKMRNVLAVVREHLPVRPDRETIARAIRDAGLVEIEAVHEGHGAEEVIHSHLRPVVNAVLTAWPGESRATVQAEALRDAADTIERYAQRTDVRLTEHAVAESGCPHVLREYADRLDPKEK